MQDEVVQIGAAVLRQVATPLSQKDLASTKVRTLIKKMQRVLAKEEFGVAIAAPQVGESLRLFVVSEKVFETEAEQPAKQKSTVFINPYIIRLSRKKHEMAEGCLSVRGKYGSVLRHDKATVRAQDEAGKPFTYHASGLLAHIFQHECDHLEGVLYVDKAQQLRNEKEPSAERPL